MAHHKIPRIEIPILIMSHLVSSPCALLLSISIPNQPPPSAPMFVWLAVDPLSSFLFVSFPKLSVVKWSFVANFIAILDPFSQDRVSSRVEEGLIIIYVPLFWRTNCPAEGSINWHLFFGSAVNKVINIIVTRKRLMNYSSHLQMQLNYFQFNDRHTVLMVLCCAVLPAHPPSSSGRLIKENGSAKWWWMIRFINLLPQLLRY